MNDDLKELLEDLGIDTFANEGKIPYWLIDLAQKILDCGYHKKCN